MAKLVHAKAIILTSFPFFFLSPACGTAMDREAMDTARAHVCQSLLEEYAEAEAKGYILDADEMRILEACR
jgi:hypothetical protein